MTPSNTQPSLLTQLLTPRQTTPDPGTAQTPLTSPLDDTLADDPLARVLAAPNPLLEAARPLLRALADIPELGRPLPGEDLESTRLTLMRDMHQFQQLCDRAGFRREQVIATRYCLCTALDEAMYKIPEAGGEWSSKSLLLLFHNETNGGEKFFLLLGYMVQSPEEHLHVLEVLYHILSLGFEGRYALMTDGTRQLETIHRRLLAIISERTEPAQTELSPHWRGSGGGRLRFMRSVPVWVSASVLALVLLALLMTHQAELTPQAATLVQRLHGLALTPDPQAPALAWSTETPLDRWFTPEEIARFDLRVDLPSQSLTIPGNLAFINGTEPHPELGRILDIVAPRLKASSRSARVVGHTDSTRLRAGSVFRDNQHLSEARAATVVQALVKRGVEATRLHAAGKSDTAPVADNATAAGRALNRRVEITLLPAEVKL